MTAEAQRANVKTAAKALAEIVHRPKLSHWVNTQRQFQREGRLDPERKRRLDESGFDSDPKSKSTKAQNAAQ